MRPGSYETNVTYKLLVYKSYTVKPRLSNIVCSKIMFDYQFVQKLEQYFP